MTLDTALILVKGRWWRNPSDLSLTLIECGQGNRRSLEILYSVLAAGIKRRLVYILRDTALAEDVLHETFVSIWRYADRFDPKMSIPAVWIWTIARNRACSVLKGRKRECGLADIEDFDNWPDLSPTPFDNMLREEEAAVLAICLEKLDPVERECVDLAYFHGLSYSEVSRRTGRPIGSVKTIFRRSLKILRDCMQIELAANPISDAGRRPVAGESAAA